MSDTIDLGQLSVKEVDNLERRLRAMLYVVWEIRGTDYEIVPAGNGQEQHAQPQPS